MEIRLVQAEEIPQADYIWSQAFREGDRSPSGWIDTTGGGSFTCGVWDEGGLQATVLVNDFRVHLGAEVVTPMGGIGGVASLPPARGKGYAGECLKYALAQMRERDMSISMLFPFSWDYYRRFGWEWIGVRRRYRVPTRILRSYPDTEHVRLATPADREAILKVYTAYAKRYRGAAIRSEAAWARFLEGSPEKYAYTFVYEGPDGMEGYLTYREIKEEETRLREFIALTPRAQRGLLGLLRRHEMQIQKFMWEAPDDDTLWSQFYHWDIETRSAPMTQGRVVDVKGALEVWKPTAEVKGSVSVQVFDEAAEWNTGTWQVTVEGGVISVQATDAAPQVSLDIQALSQAYFGKPNMDQLRAADRLTVYNEPGYTVLRDLLGGPSMWINDDF